LGSHNQQVGEQVDLATVVPATTVPALVAIAIATAAGCCIKAAITKRRVGLLVKHIYASTQ